MKAIKEYYVVMCGRGNCVISKHRKESCAISVARRYANFVHPKGWVRVNHIIEGMGAGVYNFPGMCIQRFKWKGKTVNFKEVSKFMAFSCPSCTLTVKPSRRMKQDPVQGYFDLHCFCGCHFLVEDNFR